MKYLILILATVFIGCGQKIPPPIKVPVTITKTKIVKEKIPESLLKHVPKPKVPQNIKMQSSIAPYITGLVGAIDTCNNHLDGIKEVINGR
ncbi:MAG: hypothetical protein R3331_09305 [Sulfurospirillaceae bacterium]|nr:hypothetical protein [Sulfurospirillaceae bacterium]